MGHTAGALGGDALRAALDFSWQGGCDMVGRAEAGDRKLKPTISAGV